MCLCVDLLAYNVAIHHPVQNIHAHTSYTKALWLVINYCFVAASACHCTRKCVCLRLACVHVCVPQGLNLSSSLINWGNVGDLASCTHNEFNYELTLCTIKPIALSWLSLCVCVRVYVCAYAHVLPGSSANYIVKAINRLHLYKRAGDPVANDECKWTNSNKQKTHIHIHIQKSLFYHNLSWFEENNALDS